MAGRERLQIQLPPSDFLARPAEPLDGTAPIAVVSPHGTRSAIPAGQPEDEDSDSFSNQLSARLSLYAGARQRSNDDEDADKPSSASNSHDIKVFKDTSTTNSSNAIFQKMHTVRQSMVGLKAKLQEEISRGNTRRASNVGAVDFAGSRRGSAIVGDSMARRASNVAAPGFDPGVFWGARRASNVGAPGFDPGTRRTSNVGLTLQSADNSRRPSALGLMIPSPNDSRRPSFGGSRRASGIFAGTELVTYDTENGEDGEDISSSRRPSGTGLAVSSTATSRRASMSNNSRRPSALISIKDTGDDSGDGRTMFIQIGTVETIPDGEDQASDSDSDDKDQKGLPGLTAKKEKEDWKNPSRKTEIIDPKKMPVRSMKEFLKREAALKANAMISNVKYIQQKLEETKDEAVEIKTSIQHMARKRDRRGGDDAADIDHILEGLKTRATKMKQKKTNQVREMLRNDLAEAVVARSSHQGSVHHGSALSNHHGSVLQRDSVANPPDGDGSTDSAPLDKFGPRGTLELPRSSKRTDEMAPRLSALSLLMDGESDEKGGTVKFQLTVPTVETRRDSAEIVTSADSQENSSVPHRLSSIIPPNIGAGDRSRWTAVRSTVHAGTAFALPFQKRKNLPEVPRLRSKFRGRRQILGGHYHEGKMTTKRWHEQIAESLGLSAEDWNSDQVYAVHETHLDEIAFHKEQALRARATSTIQIWWRHLAIQACLSNLNQLMSNASTLIQRWWRDQLTYKVPMKRRLRQRQVEHDAATKIQKIVRGRQTASYWWSSIEMQKIGDKMVVLQADMKMPTSKQIVSMQCAARCFIARKRVDRARRVQKSKRELHIDPETKPQEEISPKESRNTYRRVSLSVEAMKKQGIGTYASSKRLVRQRRKSVDHGNKETLGVKFKHTDKFSSNPGEGAYADRKSLPPSFHMQAGIDAALVIEDDEDSLDSSSRGTAMLLGRNVAGWSESGALLSEASLTPLPSAGQLAAASPLTVKRKRPITVTRARMYGLPQISEILGNEGCGEQSDEETQDSAEFSKVVTQVRGLQRQPTAPAKFKNSRSSAGRGASGPAPPSLKLGSLSQKL